MEAFGHKVVSNEQQQLFLGERDPRLSHNAGPLQPGQRHVCSDQQRFPGDSLDQLGCELTKLHVFAAFVLEHGFLHQLLDVSAAEQRQLADDLSDGAGAGQAHQSLTGQGSDLIRVRNGHLHRQQREQNLWTACSI